MTTDWRESALCRQVDPELWFPEKGGDNGSQAKRVCGGCPVRAECLEFAVESGQRAGIWGGLNERELRQVRFARGMSEPPRRVPVDRVYALADRGWVPEAIAADIGFHVDSVRRVLKRRAGQSEAAA